MSNTHQELVSPKANDFCKELASPKQTVLGKDISNLLMAGRLPKPTLPTSAKTTSLNEFNNTMASAIICLATTRSSTSKVKNIEAGVPFFMFLRFVQLLIDHYLGDMSDHKDIYDNPSITKKVFANMKRVGTCFSGVVTPLFDTMLVPAAEEVGLIQDDQTQAPKVPSPEPSPKHKLPLPSNDPLPGGEDSLKLKELMDLCTHLSNKVLELEKEENMNLKDLHIVHSKVDTAAPVVEKEKSFKQRRIIADIDEDDVDDEETADVEEVLEIVKAAKLMTKVVTTTGATTTAEATKVSVLRRRRGVVIQDSKETTSTVVMHSEVQSKDKEKEVKEELTVPEKEVEVHDHKREGKSLKMEVTKKQKIDEKAEELKCNLQIVTNDDDDDDNFNKEDLEILWKLVKERFDKTEPKNYTDDYLLKTLKTMFEQPNVEASVYRDQKGRLEVEEVSEMSLDLLRLVRI
nr:hypothetical protein [Tanacetum cinerariifolium]